MFFKVARATISFGSCTLGVGKLQNTVQELRAISKLHRSLNCGEVYRFCIIPL